ncbi:nucleoside diphosphate kinase [Holotrichia oblita]|uniref:Nucleoside diphosphate kinase n=1 Tax=Holotrichia oblita TaxID=644536 RepID=A0ACB9SQW8_HOLOL|nr:nucleoside diphosphate kinase [Holotrichia oblita]
MDQSSNRNSATPQQPTNIYTEQSIDATATRSGPATPKYTMNASAAQQIPAGTTLKQSINPSVGPPVSRVGSSPFKISQLDSKTAVALEKYTNINPLLQIADTDNTMTTLDDTVHYMSPVSPMTARSDYEGYHTIDYLQFLPPTIGQEDSSTYKSSTISCIEPELQRTVAIVKPDAMKYEDVVVRAINEVGFSIIQKRYIHFTPEQVSEFYSQYYGSPAFPHQVISMSVGPVLVLSLADVNAISKWRDLVGPDRQIREEWFIPMSMRVRFGLQEPIANAVHASDNLVDANKENRYVYPRNVLEPFIHEFEKVQDYCNLYVNPTLLNGLTALVKAKPADPVMYLAEWLLRNNPYQPQFSKDINLLPT